MCSVKKNSLHFIQVQVQVSGLFLSYEHQKHQEHVTFIFFLCKLRKKDLKLQKKYKDFFLRKDGSQDPLSRTVH